jgi:hypothetical protein
MKQASKYPRSPCCGGREFSQYVSLTEGRQDFLCLICHRVRTVKLPAADEIARPVLRLVCIDGERVRP